MNNKDTEYNGIIKTVLFTGEENFSIVRVKLDNGKEITALGKIPCPIKNSRINLKGYLKENKKYKEKQLHVTYCKSSLSNEDITAIQFLGSGAIKGIGISTARKIVSQLGNNISEIMQNPEELLKVSGITQKKLSKMLPSYRKNMALFEIFEITNGKISLNQAQKIHQKYGEDASKVLRDNPYQIIYDISGFGFFKADDLAKKIGFSFDSTERILAGLVYCVRMAEQENGDCFLYFDELKKRAIDLLLTQKELIAIYYQDVLKTTIPDDVSSWEEISLGNLVKNHAKKTANILESWHDEVYRDKVCDENNFSTNEIETIDIFCSKKEIIENELSQLITYASIDLREYSLLEAEEALLRTKEEKFLVLYKNDFNENIVYDKTIFESEIEVAKNLINIMNSPLQRHISAEKIDSIIEGFAKKHYMPDDSQIKGIHMALSNRVSIVTGGPGVGKTTTMNLILKGWQKTEGEDKAECIALAPTGKAAKRLSENIGIEAKTIHKFAMEPAVLNNDTLVIVDEFSMVDLNLFKKLLRRIMRCHLVLVGDINQLKSLGAGNVLEDLIKSDVVPCTELTECHRNDGTILENSQKIKNHCLLKDLKTDNHFKTLWVNADAESLAATAIRYYEKMLEKFSISEIIMLGAMRKGPCGIESLNKMIQKQINPKATNKKEITFGEKLFREGDRVIHIKNNYNMERLYDGEKYPETGVFNGDTGTILSIDELEETINVRFDDDSIAVYEKTDLIQLELAYALTYHKSQGSEYPCVICILKPGDYILLQNCLIYTGESRGQTLVTFLGVPKAFQMAIDDSGGVAAKRNTGLKNALVEINKE